jgi:hypothetical protein
MHRVLYTVSMVVLSLSLARLPATAAPAAHPMDAATMDRDVEQSLRLAEDLRLLDALKPLELSANQIDELLPIVDGAQASLGKLETDRKRAIAERKAALAQAWQQAIHGGKPSSHLQQQLILLQDTSDRKAKQARMDMVISISGKLNKDLTEKQLKQVKTLIRTRLLNQASPFGLTGDPDLHPSTSNADPNAAISALHERITRQLDRVREADPGAEYELERATFVNQFMKGMDTSSPEYHKQLTTLLDQVSQIHSMTPEQFAQQKDDLVGQFAQMRYAARVRVQMGRADESKVQYGTDLEPFVDEVLLNPRAAAVLREMRKSL